LEFKLTHYRALTKRGDPCNLQSRQRHRTPVPNPTSWTNVVAVAWNAGRDQLELLVAIGWSSRSSSLECARSGLLGKLPR
jgi:hypothetical protein